jgi:hypothetical protein
LFSRKILFSFSYQFLIEYIETANKDAQLTQTSKSLSILSNLLVSLLHPWLFDNSVDQICHERLQLQRTNRFLSYGILSKNEHLTIVLPTWQQYLNDNIPESFLSNPNTLISFVGMETNEAESLKQYVDKLISFYENNYFRKQERIESYVYHWRWKYSSILNTEHLLSLVTMVYILMNCDRWIDNK